MALPMSFSGSSTRERVRSISYYRVMTRWIGPLLSQRPPRDGTRPGWAAQSRSTATRRKRLSRAALPVPHGGHGFCDQERQLEPDASAVKFDDVDANGRAQIEGAVAVNLSNHIVN